MQRRDFLTLIGALAGGGTLHARLARAVTHGAGGETGPAAGRLDRIGLELYAVRRAMRADPERTLAAVRAIGYTDVELLWSFGNFGRTPQQVRDTLAREGLAAPSAHIAPETILTDWERRLDEARLLGHRYLVAPSFPAEANASVAAWHRWVDRFNAAGEVARSADVWLALHNEPNHERPIEGRQPLELFMARADPRLVRFQLDVGNMLMGGGDPMAFLARHVDRCWSFHLKNVPAAGSGDTELGKGTFDLARFLSRVPDLPRKPCFVEQEGGADELASARENWRHVDGLRW